MKTARNGCTSCAPKSSSTKQPTPSSGSSRSLSGDPRGPRRSPAPLPRPNRDAQAVNTIPRPGLVDVAVAADLITDATAVMRLDTKVRRQRRWARATHFPEIHHHTDADRRNGDQPGEIHPAQFSLHVAIDVTAPLVDRLRGEIAGAERPTEVRPQVAQR